MNCFNCGRKIALYMKGTDDINGQPHCAACREYERKIEKLEEIIGRIECDDCDYGGICEDCPQVYRPMRDESATIGETT